MVNAYYAKYVDGHHGSLDRIGGLPTHLPDVLPRCECGPAPFLLQLYFEGKTLAFVPRELMGIQLYSCNKCVFTSVVPITINALQLDAAAPSIQPSEIDPALRQDIHWTEMDDPQPTRVVDEFWDNDDIRPEYLHLLDDKLGGCFPTVDHGGTAALDLGIVAQLSVRNTIYITCLDDQWGFFHY